MGCLTVCPPRWASIVYATIAYWALVLHRWYHISSIFSGGWFLIASTMMFIVYAMIAYWALVACAMYGLSKGENKGVDKQHDKQAE